MDAALYYTLTINQYMSSYLFSMSSRHIGRFVSTKLVKFWHKNQNEFVFKTSDYCGLLESYISHETNLRNLCFLFHDMFHSSQRGWASGCTISCLRFLVLLEPSCIQMIPVQSNHIQHYQHCRRHILELCPANQNRKQPT